MKRGIVGVVCPNAAEFVFLALQGIQCRGVYHGGIMSMDSDGELRNHSGSGLVSGIFNGKKLEALPGNFSIGQVDGSPSEFERIQPIKIIWHGINIGAVNDGQLSNTIDLKKKLFRQGRVFRLGITTGTELFIHLFVEHYTKEQQTIEAFKSAVLEMQGSFALILLLQNRMIAIRDPRGSSPLIFGKLPKGYMVASETAAFSLLDATYVREIKPGEIVVFSEESLKSYYLPEERLCKCIGELMWKAHIMSRVYGRDVNKLFYSLGELLAADYPLTKEAVDFIVPIPGAGFPVAEGYANKLGLPLRLALTRNHFTGEIHEELHLSLPTEIKTKLKISPNFELFKEARIALIDAGLAFGNTLEDTVSIIRKCGAREVHCLVASPPRSCSCKFDIADRPLLFSDMNFEEARKALNADSLHLLSEEAFYSEFGEGFCDCFRNNKK